MIVGFFGKGGSGKTTLSSRFVRFLVEQGKNVLAIDADHNMDLAYNLGINRSLPYLGDALPVLKRSSGLEPKEHYSKAVIDSTGACFSISPPDPFTEQFSVAVGERLRFMSAGPHTEQVLHGDACSHILTTPLKVYLPLLDVRLDEAVVLDMTAGMDSAGSGIATGLDLAVIVAEATPHGLKAARQIADGLSFYDVPFVFVLNKSRNIPEDIGNAREILGQEPSFLFALNKEYILPDAPTEPRDMETYARMVERIRTLVVPGKRLERSREKFLRNEEWKREAGVKQD